MGTIHTPEEIAAGIVLSMDQILKQVRYEAAAVQATTQDGVNVWVIAVIYYLNGEIENAQQKAAARAGGAAAFLPLRAGRVNDKKVNEENSNFGCRERRSYSRLCGGHTPSLYPRRSAGIQHTTFHKGMQEFFVLKTLSKQIKTHFRESAQM